MKALKIIGARVKIVNSCCMKYNRVRRRALYMKTLKLCMIGFGNVGGEFCRLLEEKKAALLENNNCRVIITEIATKSRGILRNVNGIDTDGALDWIEKKGSFKGHEDYINLNSEEVIKSTTADALLELSTLSVMDGQPAIKHIETAFDRNMHVITANKGPIAWRFKKLDTRAKEENVVFLYETVVMDGTPIFNLVRNTLQGCRVLSFRGILNTTTNYILCEMEKGNSFEEAVKEAQRRGFAEADPSLDVDGWDAAAKTAALMNVLMDAEVTPLDIKREGISGVIAADVLRVKQEGSCIKLICEGFFENGISVGRVYPKEIDESSIYSKIDATSSVLSVTTDLMGEISIVEHDPEIRQTAYGVYSDLLALLGRI